MEVLGQSLPFISLIIPRWVTDAVSVHSLPSVPAVWLRIVDITLLSHSLKAVQRDSYLPGFTHTLAGAHAHFLLLGIPFMPISTRQSLTWFLRVDVTKSVEASYDTYLPLHIICQHHPSPWTLVILSSWPQFYTPPQLGDPKTWYLQCSCWETVSPGQGLVLTWTEILTSLLSKCAFQISYWVCLSFLIYSAIGLLWESYCIP